MSRYIDADALMKSIRNIRDMQNFKTNTNWYSAYDEFLDLIEDFPTADVVPSRFGCGSAPYCSDVWEVDEDE